MPPQKRTAPAAVFTPPTADTPVEPAAPVIVPPTAPADEFAEILVYGAEDFARARKPIVLSPTLAKVAVHLAKTGRCVITVDGWEASKVNVMRKQLTSVHYGGRKIRFTAGTVEGKQALLVSLSDPTPETPAS